MKFQRIRMKIFLAMMLATALPLIITSVMLFYQVSRSIKADHAYARTRIEQDLKGRIADFAASFNETAYQIYSNPDLTETIALNKEFLAESRTYDTNKDIEQFFLSVYYQSRMKEIIGMYLLRNNGDILGSLFPAVYPKFDQSYYRDLLDQARLNQYQPTGAVLQTTPYGEPIFQFLYPVRYRGKPSGLLVIDMKEEAFREQVERYNVFDHGTISVVDASGQTVYDTDPKQTGFQFTDTTVDSRTITIQTPIAETGWILYYRYRIQTSQILYRNLAVIMIGVAGILAVILSIGLSFNLTKPIVQLHRKMRLLQIGDYNARVEVVSRDEIGFLGSQFNQMAETIQHLVEHEMKLKLINKDTQIKALQAQISPHFLFNTLQLMAGIAEVNRVPDMKLICQALSHMYRYNMNIDNEWVPLRDEIMHIRSYLVIINKRFNGAIRFRLDIGPASQDVRVPKLILQPIIENAVEHGLMPKPAGPKLLKLSLRVDREKSSLLIHVLDNGIGMEEKHKLEAELILKESDIRLDEEHPIGLANVHARIRLICGESFGIRLTSRPGRGTCVTYTLPMKEA